MTAIDATANLPHGPAQHRPDAAFLKRKVRVGEKIIELFLLTAAFSSVVITLGIVAILIKESIAFFHTAGIINFLTDTQWAPTFEPARFGILPLLCGTVTVTLIALVVAMPLGTIAAIWLSEYAPHKLREAIKPTLELLGAVPTVVYGYFALLFVSPILQTMLGWVGIELSGFNMLSAGLVIGIMIIPYVSSLSEDAMHAVPMHMREGSYAMGATRMQTALRVVVPASFSGITASYILGISRALGETMVVAVAAGMQAKMTMNPTEPAQTMTAFIVQVSLGDLPHGTTGYQSIFAVGLSLMLMTLVFNIGGYILRKRYRETY